MSNPHDLSELIRTAASESDDMFTSEIEQLASKIDAMKATEQAQAEEPVVSDEERFAQEVLDVFNKMKDRPSDQQIVKWKDQFGTDALRVLSLDSQHVYLYTRLTLKQWKQIQSLRDRITNEKQAALVEESIQNSVVKACTLWPKLTDEDLMNGPAGLPATLFQLIMLHSYFFTPQQAMMFTTAL